MVRMLFVHVVVLTALVVLLPTVCHGALTAIMERCCTTGRQWFTTSRERCSMYRDRITNVAPDELMACQAVIELCCLKEKQEKQCKQGKQIARIRQSCDALHSQLGNWYSRECCSCCKLGLVAQLTGLPCNFLATGAMFNAHCIATFSECCMGDQRTTTTTTVAPSTLPPELEDLNECEAFPSQLCSQICINTIDSYKCACEPGFVLKADGRTCAQEVNDRCQLNNPCQHLCVDTGVAIHCKCHDGYMLEPDGQHCRDIDECMIGTHTCTRGQRCVNTLGTFACEGVAEANRCPSGFAHNRVTRRCEDINECLLSRRICPGTQLCTNTVGSFRCVQRGGVDEFGCESGYTFNRATEVCEDINECALNRDTCLAGQHCENTKGSFECRRSVSCGTGYTIDRNTQTCKDDDECTLATHNCGLARECRNTPGSFRCVEKQCPERQILDYTTGQCRVVNCHRGMRPDRAGNCIDINECVETPTVCRPTQECRNTIGSFTCRNLVNCGPGYELNEQGTACLDIDECDRGTHDCTGALQQCVNRRGTYMCRCPDGYQMNHGARSCDDIDECQRYSGQVCSQNAKCENTRGSFRCVCNDGFEAEGEGRTCRDVDECKRSGICQHNCRNTWGSYQCTCTDGYQLSSDGRTCEDIDECEFWSERGLCVGVCQNTPGSYTCSCPDGFDLMLDGRTCQDIDECALQTANCNGANKLCINTRGSFKCETITCPKGFVRAPSLGNTNNNIRCQRKTFVCPQGDTECLYAPLSYSMNFITFPSKIRIPADLFTMRGPFSPYRRLEFKLKLVRATDPVTGIQRVTENFFNLRRVGSNEAIVQLLREIPGPQDLELELNMNIFSKEFREQGGEVFFGTAVAKIMIYVTQTAW